MTNFVRLPYQQDALEAIIKALPPKEQWLWRSRPAFANPPMPHAGDEKHFIDVKMETGTGKTYVYTSTMFKLHQQFGLFKFIVVVPSLAIKIGAKNFITDADARRHFSQEAGYGNVSIALYTVNKGNFTGKGGRKIIPSDIIRFCQADKNDKNTIHCLLCNSAFLDKVETARGKTVLFKDDYDANLIEGINCPAEALKACVPVVIIDEPHRMKQGGKAYSNIREHIAPQSILRFGATFPNGKNGESDYFRGAPQYELTAADAFNQDLVKGVYVQYPELAKDKQLYKVHNLSAKELVLQRQSDKKLFSVGAHESLGSVDADFGDLTYEGGKKLSNERELVRGETLMAGVYALNYQENMLKLALKAHFETEIENFHRPKRKEGFRVKTLALFFIDDIQSYRNADGWLKQSFEKLLKAKLDALLEQYPEGEYHEYLAATKRNIAGAHGGYFAEDWGEPDGSATREEIEDILHKERTLPFKKTNGDWNIRRFFFSKWTLREGWDNPNVFTICKLRSSGSETSKIQEVGRGLRLPVDEKGNRLASQWWLNFLIGYDEADFAEKLKADINRDSKDLRNTERLTDAMIGFICQKRGIETGKLRNQLGAGNIIDFNGNFKLGGYKRLLELYPELQGKELKSGKIRNKGEKPETVKLNRENWDRLKAIWKRVSTRHLLSFEPLPQGEIAALFERALNEAKFNDNANITVQVARTQKDSATGQINMARATKQVENEGNIGDMPYSEFIKRLNSQTCVPVHIIHEKLYARLMELYSQGESVKEVNNRLNLFSLNNIIKAWREIFAEKFGQRYSYHALKYQADTSIMEGGQWKREIAAALLGRQRDNAAGQERRNLFAVPPAYFDSEIEQKIERIEPRQEVLVFGKLPKQAIRIPTYTGSTTSPDFVFAFKGEEENVRLVLFVEAKSADKRGSEMRNIAVQSKFFREQFPNTEWREITDSRELAELLENYCYSSTERTVENNGAVEAD